MQLLWRLLVALSCMLSPLLAGTAVAQTKPHFVIFIADDHGQLDSTPYGATDLQTPNMQRLAKAGMTFTHAFATSPSCAPSRASILTGLMPNRHGAMVNHARPKDEVVKWPAYLRMLGYLCAAFGKVAHYGQDKLYGFDHYHRFHDVKTVASFLEMHDVRKPLCLFVGTHSPHVPWPEKATYDAAQVKLPAAHVDTSETRALRARYYTAVSKADADLGHVIDLVRARLGDNVLFIYTSDHGAQWPFGKWNLYDAGIRVPLLAAWPGVIQPASQADAMISLADLLPTMIAIGGGKAPANLDGKSFADVLRGKKTNHREYIFSTHSRDGVMNVCPIRAVRTRDWAYIRNLDPKATHTTHIDKAAKADGVIYWSSWIKKAKADAPAAKIVERYHQRPAEELHDLKNDPLQLRNVAADPANADRLAQLRMQLDTWMIQQADEGLKTEKVQAIQPPIKRAGGPRLKISLNAYSFNKTLNDHLKGGVKGMSLFDLLDFCAENDFDAIDPTGYYFPGYPKAPSDQFLNAFKRRAFVLGLDISGTGVRTHFASADKNKRAADVEHVKEWVEVAARLGAPVLRVFAGAHPEGYDWDQVAAWMVEDLRKCVEHGKKHGVIIRVQQCLKELRAALKTE